MSNVYKKVELVGTSRESVDDAIRGAIGKATETLSNVYWFEVDEIRGWIKDGEMQHIQVVMKVGFLIDQDDSAEGYPSGVTPP